MKKIFHALLIITIICFNNPIYGMKRKKNSANRAQKNHIQITPDLSQDCVIEIAGHCKPTEKIYS